MTLIFYEKEKPLLNVVFSSCPGFCEDYEHISSWLFDIFHARDHKQFYMKNLFFFYNFICNTCDPEDGDLERELFRIDAARSSLSTPPPS